MPDAAPDAVLGDLAARGGNVVDLQQLPPSELTAALKALGYGKLGERARVISALKQAPAAAVPPVELEAASAPAAPSAPAAATSDGDATLTPDSTMVMHGAVLDIHDDGGLLKTTLRAGEASSGRPPPLSRCKVRYIASVLPECRRFEALVREFQMGEEQVPRGLEKCVSTMHKGETCELIARAEYAYGDDGRLPDVPPGSSLRYELELISWVPPKKERFELTDEERFEEARRLKQLGTNAFSSGLYLDAQVHYHEASRLLLTDFEELRAPSGKELECRALLLACMLNVAQCALRREEWFAAEKACTSVLEQLADPMGREKEQHQKALYRRAKARIARSEFDLARKDVKAANALNPNSREVRELWDSIREREVTETKKESQAYSKMTQKLVYREYNVSKKKLSSYPRVYFDLSIAGRRTDDHGNPNRVVFELFTDRAPKTCENFRALCTGERGYSDAGVRLHYKNTRFHRAFNYDDLAQVFVNESADQTGRFFEVWKGFLVQGGDITNGDGSGGESIYGGEFEDEQLPGGGPSDLKFTGPGLLAMCGTPPMRDQKSEEAVHIPNCNTSQFFITTKERNHAQGGSTILHFNGRHTIFGKVAEGINVVQNINRCKNDPSNGHLLMEEVLIVDCGQLLSKEEEAAEKDSAWLVRDGSHMIPDKKDEGADEYEYIPPDLADGVRGEWEVVKPTPKPTEEDLAIRSAEVDDDD